MIKNKKKLDWQIIFYLTILLIFGIVSIYSASTTKIDDDLIVKNHYIKQILWIVIGLAVYFVILIIPLHFLELSIIPGYIMSLIMLSVVLFLPEVNGSHRWIEIGSFHIQPSEIAKIFTILLLSHMLAKDYKSDLHKILIGITVLFPAVLLILLEPDLGTSLTFCFILLAMFSVAEINNVWLLFLVSPIISIILSFSAPLFFIFLLLFIIILVFYKMKILGIVSASVVQLFLFLITPYFWNFLKSYQRDRILTFLDPARDPFGSGYQIIQAKIAIGSGGFWGKGFLEGTQKNLNFLPEHHTDFIFSVIGEEFGFFGCLILLTFYFLFLFRIAMNIRSLKRNKMRLAGVGILAYFSFQVLINIGMNLGVMPTTGIPLPFISYGGSSLVINMIAVGLICKFLLEKSIFE